jgi:hypothetical protein
MRRVRAGVRAAALAVWGFIVGEDWRTAVGVVLALALTSLVAALNVAAWWVMPLAVPMILALSLRRASRD